MLEEYIFSNSSEFSIHEKVNHHSERLIADALAGLHYLQTYERTLIRAMVSMAYTGWAAWAGSRVFFPLSSKRVGSHNIATVAIQFLSLTVLFGMSGMFWMEHAPWTYYLYLGFPVSRNSTYQATPKYYLVCRRSFSGIGSFPLWSPQSRRIHCPSLICSD